MKKLLILTLLAVMSLSGMAQLKVEPMARLGIFTKGNNISIPMQDGTVWEQSHNYNFEWNGMVGARANWGIFTSELATKTYVLSNSMFRDDNPHTQEWTFLVKADLNKISLGVNYLRYDRLSSRYKDDIHNFVPFGDYTELFIGFNL